MRYVFKIIGFHVACFLYCLRPASPLRRANAKISVIGSGIANALVKAIVGAPALDMFEVKTTGTVPGVDQFCQGGYDVVTASRPISAAEAANCLANEVEYNEFLLAHKIVAFAANDSIPVTCLSLDQLELFLKPSSSNQQMDWSAFVADEEEAPALTLFTPVASTLEYAVVDELVAGDRLRRDVEVYSNVDDAVTRVMETAGALAMLPYSPDLVDKDGLTVLGFEDGETGDCIQPSAENVEANLYAPAQSLYAYVDRAAFANDSLTHVLELLASDVSAAAIMRAGFNPPSSNANLRNSQVLADPGAAVTAGDGETEFEIPPNLTGEIRVSGAANAYQLLDQAASLLSGANPQLQIDIGVSSQIAAIRDLCGGELDVAMLDTDLSNLDLQDCSANGIETLLFPVGAQATILLSNSADAYAECLSHEQIKTIWQAAGADMVKAWNDIDSAFPPLDLLLLAPFTVDRYADMLFAGSGAGSPPIRRDTESHFDPLYRAAAVGNVSGALTYMSWRDYQNVLDNDHANVQLVGIDDGAGCVKPSEASISDGSYPLARQAMLGVSDKSLASVNVQSLLWSLYGDDNWERFAREGFAAIARADFAGLRRQLETQFRLAEAKYLTELTTDQPPEDESG